MIRRAQVWSQALPFQQFHVLFNSLFKVLFIFRSLYLCAIGLWPIFSFRRHIPPILSSIPKLLDSSKELYRGSAASQTGLSPSVASRSRELGRHLTKSILYKLQLGPWGPDFKFELLPLHSPLLGQSLLVSFPPLIDMLKFSGYSYLIRGQHFRSWVFNGCGRAALPMRVCKLLRRRGCGETATVFRRRPPPRQGRSPTPTPRRGSRVEMTLGQACPPEYWRAQCAFKDSMIH